MSPAEFEAARLVPGMVTIHFEHGEPISALRLGALISVMAREYAKFDPDGELVLVYAETGSLFLKWAKRAGIAALAVAAAGNTVGDFANHIGAAIETARNHASILNGRRSGVKSAAEVLEVAVESGSRFRLAYESPDGERLLVEMDAPEAKQLLDNAKEQKNVRLQEFREPPKALTHQQIERQIEQLLADPAQNPDSLRTLVAVFVELLTSSGMSHSAEMLAQNLELKGQYQAAQLVREEQARQHGAAIRIRQ